MSVYETHKLADAMKDKMAEPGLPPGQAGHAGPPEPAGHGSTPREVAEEARRQDEARDNGRDRNDHLITIGRADQTSGRQ